MAAIFLPRMGLRLVRTSSPGLQILRGLMLVVSSVVFVRRAAAHADRGGREHRLPRADHRRARRRPAARRARRRAHLARAGRGFTGVLLIIRPGGSAFTWWAFAAAAAAPSCSPPTRSSPASSPGHDDPDHHPLLSRPRSPCSLHPAGVPRLEVTGLPSVPLHARDAGRHRHPGAVGHFLLIRAHSTRRRRCSRRSATCSFVVVLVLGWVISASFPTPSPFAASPRYRLWPRPRTRKSKTHCKLKD